MALIQVSELLLFAQNHPFIDGFSMTMTLSIQLLGYLQLYSIMETTASIVIIQYPTYYNAMNTYMVKIGSPLILWLSSRLLLVISPI